MRRERQALVVVAEKESIGVECEADLLRLHRFSVWLAQNGKKDLVHRLTADGHRAPVDVEVVQEAGIRTVLQNAHPPAVLGAGGHVIGDHIEQQAELALFQLLVQRAEILLASEIGIECRGVDHVVAMRAPLPRFEDRRCVNVADAEGLQIRRGPLRVGKSEAGIELQPVRGAGNAVHAL